MADDRLGRVLDGLFLAGLSSCFVSIAMKAIAKFEVSIETAHLDSTSFHLHGQYETANDEVVVTQKSEDGTRVEIEVAPKAIYVTYGYSRDHRSDLKQFVMNLICGGEGGIPLFLEMADGNQDDKTKFAHLFEEFQKQWTFEGVHIADSALYTADNLKMKWESTRNWDRGLLSCSTSSLQARYCENSCGMAIWPVQVMQFKCGIAYDLDLFDLRIWS